jgi:NSS family neurotransmitter:Na+ symporter
VLDRDVFRDELALKYRRLFPLIYSLLRYVAPAGILIILVTELTK